MTKAILAARKETTHVLKKVFASALGAGALGLSLLFVPTGTANASPAIPTWGGDGGGPCNGAPDATGGGGGGWGGGGYVDCHFAVDGSHDHCAHVVVLGWGGWQCGRVGP